MNRRAVAMAADSASTITRWVRGERKRRFFKGTNKVFHLSRSEPIGMMIYGAGDLQGVPWEVLTKTFRDESLKGHWHRSLSGYVGRFFKWLETNKYAFPETFLEEQFLSEVMESAGRVLRDALLATKDVEKDKQRQTIVDVFSDTAANVETAPYIGNADAKDVKNALEKYSAEVQNLLSKSAFLSTFCHIVGEERLRDIAVQAIFKEDFTTLNDSGIVFAEFG